MAWQCSGATNAALIGNLNSGVSCFYLLSSHPFPLCPEHGNCCKPGISPFLFLAEAGIISEARVLDAMKSLDRKFYCPPGAKPYEDAPQVQQPLQW